MQKITLDEVLAGIKRVDSDLTFPLDDYELIENMFYELDNDAELGLNFSVYLRNDRGGESWVQAEYMSQKLGKSVIWDYDFENFFGELSELAQKITDNHNAIVDFESSITVEGRAK